jgi:hypothetical protein
VVGLQLRRMGPAALRGSEADPAPVVVGRGSCARGAVDVRLPSEGHLGTRLALAGFDGGEPPAGQRGNLVAVDEMVSGQLRHVGLPGVGCV